jgi:putative sterol carrier protein
MKHAQGMAEKADATLTMASEDFVALTKGQLNPMNAFMSGKIKVAGDMGLVMKLQSLLTG